MEFRMSQALLLWLCTLVVSSGAFVSTTSFFGSHRNVANEPDSSGKRTTGTAVQLSSGKGTSGPPVGKEAFLTAIETLHREAAKQRGDTYEGPPAEIDGKKLDYLVGRLEVEVPVNILHELDLTESSGLVLVSGLTEKVQDAGIQPLDTIVGFSAGSAYSAPTPAATLEEMAVVFQTAVQHAVQSGSTSIKIELNRLLKGYYDY